MNEDSSSEELNISGLLSAAHSIPRQIDLLVGENQRLHAVIVQQKEELDKMSSTVKIALALKNREASFIFQEGKQIPPHVIFCDQCPITKLEKMSSTFKTEIALKDRTIKDLQSEFDKMLALKNREINELENEVKRVKEEEQKVVGVTASEESQPINRMEEVSGEEELPEDVTTLDELKKLNQLINSEEFDLTHPFWDKISLFYGDITKINVDAIVNAANERLDGGGRVDSVTHRAAGYNQLQAECRKHDRPVANGQAVITDACKLSTHIKKIIHCVGPICYGGVTKERRNQLESCYRRAMQLSEENGLRSIAFPCISTGIYGYDNKDAAKTVLKFLYQHLGKENNAEKFDRVVLCLFMDIDKHCYKHFITQLVRNPNLFDEEEEESEESLEEENEE